MTESVLKDRLYHPESYVLSMLVNWKEDSDPWKSAQMLLTYIEESRFDSVRNFIESHKEIGESQGSAFDSLLSFAEEFTERYERSLHCRIILRTLQRARLATIGQNTSDNIHLLSRSDGAETIAILVSLDRPDPVVVPLAAGKNLIGRGNSSQPYGRWPKPYAVEQGQWILQCDSADAQVWDAGSTDEGFLLPNPVAPKILAANVDFLELKRMDGVVLIPHPNKASLKHRYPLSDGDVLIGGYAPFIFSWF